jgi:hypothetical protein
VKVLSTSRLDVQKLTLNVDGNRWTFQIYHFFPVLEPGLPQAVPKLLSKLGYFGSNDGTTIRLEGIVGEVFLVVILSRIELVKGRDLGHDGVIPNMRIGNFLDYLPCNLSLLLVVIEDG